MKQHKDYDIAEIMRSRPHLFILGAGATKATIPNGDKYGRQSPVMENFMQEIGIDGLLDGVKLKTKSNNIEAIYSELASKPEYTDVVRQIEDGIVEVYALQGGGAGLGDLFVGQSELFHAGAALEGTDAYLGDGGGQLDLGNLAAAGEGIVGHGGVAFHHLVSPLGGGQHLVDGVGVCLQIEGLVFKNVFLTVIGLRQNKLVETGTHGKGTLAYAHNVLGKNECAK